MLLHPLTPRRAATLAVGLLVSFCAPQAAAQFGIPAGVNLGIGLTPEVITGVATGDLDGDGFGDIVGVDSANPGNVGLALGQLGGTYAVQAVIPGGISGSPTGLGTPQLADFDNDGFLDLIASGTDAAGANTAVHIYQGIPGAGTYTFVLQTVLPVAPLPGEVTGLRTTDFTADGLQEFLATNTSAVAANRVVGLRRNLGGFIFGPMTSQTTATGASDIDICVDFNNDKLKDLVICRPAVAGGAPGFVDVYAGVGAGPFNPQPPFIPQQPTISLQMPSGFSPIDVHFIECDQKNGYDLAIAVNGPTPGIFVVRNLGAAPFYSQAGLATPFAVTNVPTSIQRAESNFDGVEDLLVYALNPTGPTLKQATIEVLSIKDCSPASISVTGAGSSNTSVVSAEKGALLAVGDQSLNGKQDLLLVDHSTAGGSTVNVYANIAPVEYTISPTAPLLGEVTQMRFLIEAPAFPGRPFLVLFSLNGSIPGTPAGFGLTVPLNLPFQPFFIQGTLSAAGSGSFSTQAVTFPSAPVTFSQQMTSAVVVMQTASGPPIHVTNPAIITLP